MKKFTLTLAVLATAAFSTTAIAGSLADPVIAAPVIVDDATSSSSGTALVAIMAVILSIPVLD